MRTLLKLIAALAFAAPAFAQSAPTPVDPPSLAAMRLP